MSNLTIKNLDELNFEAKVPLEWKLRVFIDEDCLSYLVWNLKTHEALIIDPKKYDNLSTFSNLKQEFADYCFLGVVDTHTHADHISSAPALAEEMRIPLIMSDLCSSRRVHFRVARETVFSTRAGSLLFIPSPGHTPDGMCIVWGPFVFTGDTVLYGDVGRDDLPGGSASDHYDTLQKLLKKIPPDLLVCPGHDNKGGRFSTWAHQVKVNSSLTQGRDEYISEAQAFDANPPKLLKKALFENLK